jgi:hypothetical protein
METPPASAFPVYVDEFVCPMAMELDLVQQQVLD